MKQIIPNTKPTFYKAYFPANALKLLAADFVNSD
jgi:hypothetical protein